MSFLSAVVDNECLGVGVGDVDVPWTVHYCIRRNFHCGLTFAIIVILQKIISINIIFKYYPLSVIVM